MTRNVSKLSEKRRGRKLSSSEKSSETFSSEKARCTVCSRPPMLTRKTIEGQQLRSRKIKTSLPSTRKRRREATASSIKRTGLPRISSHS